MIPKSYRRFILLVFLWFSLTVNIYFLILQPAAVFSLRRLVFSAGAAALLGGLMGGIILFRPSFASGWPLSPMTWRLAIFLTAVLYLIVPAPRLHTLIPPTTLTLKFQSLEQDETALAILWWNNGLADISFKEVDLPKSAEITPQGIALKIDREQPVEVRWRGRIWQEMTITLQSEADVRLSAQMGLKITEHILAGGGVERKLRLAYLSPLYYILIYLLVMAAAVFSVSWLAQVGLGAAEIIRIGSSTSISRYLNGLPWLVLAALGVFYGLTLRSGHPWGDDFAQYIAHARNLAVGQPYTAIGILQNPAVVLGPSAYPPLLPLLLAPVYAVFGLNLTAFKVLIALFLLLGLIVLNEWLKTRKIAAPLRALALLLTGLHPWYWDYKDQILSDMLFVLLGLLALVLWEAWNSKNGMKVGWLLGLCLLAAIAARSVGLVLWIAILLDAVLHQYWRKRGFLPAAVVPLAGVILLNLLLPGTGDYLEQARRWDWTVLQRNLSDMITIFLQIWRSDRLLIGGISLITMLGLGLLVSGLASRLRQCGAAEFYLLGTLGMILVWPHPQGVRFYLPVFFMLVYSVLEGWRWLWSQVNHAGRGAFRPLWLAAVWLILVLFTTGMLEGFLKDYQRQPLHAFREGIDLPASREMFEFIRQETRPDEVVAFFKPRAMALLTGRAAFAPYWDVQQPDRLIEDLQAFQADYLIVWKPDYEALAVFARENPAHFSMLYENEDFEVFSIAGLR